MELVNAENLHVHGMSVGHQDMFESMCSSIAETKLRPVVGESIPFFLNFSINPFLFLFLIYRSFS